MADQGSAIDEDGDRMPPRAAVAAARRAEIEEQKHRSNGRGSEMTTSFVPGALVVILAALSAFAAWMAG